MLVSIHARHECRAIPKQGREVDRFKAVSIHARHECRAILAHSRITRALEKFQSTPGMNAGRSIFWVSFGLGFDGFNPRPA